jgi:hypothetical protein
LWCRLALGGDRGGGGGCGSFDGGFGGTGCVRGLGLVVGFLGFGAGRHCFGCCCSGQSRGCCLLELTRPIGYIRECAEWQRWQTLGGEKCGSRRRRTRREEKRRKENVNNFYAIRYIFYLLTIFHRGSAQLSLMRAVTMRQSFDTVILLPNCPAQHVQCLKGTC